LIESLVYMVPMESRGERGVHFKIPVVVVAEMKNCKGGKENPRLLGEKWFFRSANPRLVGKKKDRGGRWGGGGENGDRFGGGGGSLP